MSLLFYDGFPDPLLMPKYEWSGSLAAITAQTGRDGVANGAVGLKNLSSGAVRTCTLPTPAATCIWGIACDMMGAANLYAMRWQNAGVGQLCLSVNAGGFLEMRRGNGPGGTLLATSSGHAPVLAGDWHYYDTKVVLHSSAGSFVVKLDSVTVLNVSGANTSATSGAVEAVDLFLNNSTAVQSRWDDMYVCDTVNATATQGRPNNDFLGDIRVTALFPTGAGDNAAWTPSTGANWDCCNENPANTTDYVSSQTPGTRDLYNMLDIPGSVVTILGVQTSLYVTKLDAGPALIKPAMKENSVATVDTAQGVTFGSWTIIQGQRYYKRPSDGGLWTITDMNNLQCGMEVG